MVDSKKLGPISTCGTSRVFICLDKKDEMRFARHFVTPNDHVVYIQSPFSWGKLKSHAARENTLVVFGARPPDKAVVRFLGHTFNHIIILQHATNPRRHLQDLDFGYVKQNFRKVFLWIGFSVTAAVFGFLRSNSSSEKNITVLYFDDRYMKDWQFEKSDTVNELRCRPPDPTRYGSESDIPISEEHVSYQLIDEPFTETLGISDAQEKKLLEDLLELTGGKKIYVKIHPRSRFGKYQYAENFITSSSIHPNAEVIIGYKSGLLQFPFKAKNMILLGEDLTWKITHITPDQESSKTESYIESVQEILNEKN